MHDVIWFGYCVLCVWLIWWVDFAFAGCLLGFLKFLLVCGVLWTLFAEVMVGSGFWFCCTLLLDFVLVFPRVNWLI